MTQTAVRMKFRLLIGSHTGENEANGTPVIYRAYPPGKAHPRGLQPIIESSVDLCRKFNRPGFEKKFDRVPLSTPVSPPDILHRLDPNDKPEAEFFEEELPAPSFDQMLQSIDHMNIEELKRFAEAEEIDVGAAKSKQDFIKAIKAATANLMT